MIMHLDMNNYFVYLL